MPSVNDERDEWMLCMTQALTEQVADERLRDSLIHTFAQMADHMVNTEGRGRMPCRWAAQ